MKFRRSVVVIGLFSLCVLAYYFEKSPELVIWRHTHMLLDCSQLDLGSDTKPKTFCVGAKLRHTKNCFRSQLLGTKIAILR